MLDLSYHTCFPFITNVVDGSIFLKIFKTETSEKNIRRRYFYSGTTMMKL